MNMYCEKSVRNYSLFLYLLTLFCIILLCCQTGLLHAEEMNFRLPVYWLEIDEEDLATLYENPYSDMYYPAEFSCTGFSADCEIRFRGATSRNFPKKSWKIKFEDDDNIFGARRVNLNADYNDFSLMRNFLSNELFTWAGYPAPACSHVNVYVNGEYMGVFVQVENIDEYFLERFGKRRGALFKAKNHGGNMAPLVHDEHYSIVYEPDDENDHIALDNLKSFFCKMKYWNDRDFEDKIEQELDVDNFLQYYAVLFSLVSNDCFTKNYFLYSNPDSQEYEIFPWDNDATFGFNWKNEYQSWNETIITGLFLDYQVVFQRLMKHESWRAMFWDHVHYIVSDGFSHLDSVIDDISKDVRHDLVFDTNKQGSVEDFDKSVAQIRQFMNVRSDFLQDKTGFDTPALSNLQCSNGFIGSGGGEVTVTVKSEATQNITLMYVTDLDFSKMGDAYTQNKLLLQDDGLHGDGDAGDLEYGASITIESDYRGVIPYTFFVGRSYYPLNGLMYINYYRTHTPAVNVMNDDDGLVNNLVIGDLFTFDGDWFVEIRNKSDVQVDLSYCYLQCGEYYHMTIFPENSIIEPSGTMIMTTSRRRAEMLLPGAHLSENECHRFEPGDDIALLDPAFAVIHKKNSSSYIDLDQKKYQVVINEINYNSSDAFNSGDWVELHNTDDYVVDVSGWVFKDASDDHVFTLPQETRIEPDGYLVLVQDISLFNNIHSGVDNCVGDFEFGLRGSGELIRLFTDMDVLTDSLSYDDEVPWPEDADGLGATLSLINPYLDNALPENWLASLGRGTPGRRNDIYSEKIPDGLTVGQCYPNPFERVATIPISIQVEKKVTVSIFNITGQKVSTLYNSNMKPGLHEIMFNAATLPSGLYIYRVKTNTTDCCGKAMLIR